MCFRYVIFLLSTGYQPKQIEHEHQEGTILARYKDYVFVHPQYKCMVEVHWSLMPKGFDHDFDYDYAYFDGRQQMITFNQQLLATFEPEDMFLTLVCHGARHRFESLKWLVDLHQLVGLYPNIDWNALARRAKEERIETMFFLGVDLCRRLMGTEFCGYDQTYAQNSRINAMSKWVCEMIGKDHNPENPFTYIVFNVQLIDGFWKKVRYIFIVAFGLKVRDVASTKLPWYLTPLYYVMRAVRLIQQRGIGMLLRTLGRMVQALRDV